ncbi:hypothetical protein FXO38_01541 [Capsicum annuum]|nr:hypothetical protein FXO38_01541 [Capsicum annuum]
MDFRAPKKGKKKDQAKMFESNKESNDLCAMFSGCNLVRNPREWWMDSDATRHVCSNKELFSSFAPAQVEEMIYIANSSTAKVEGPGKVGLKMTSKKVLTLNNVLYVLELRSNLIFISPLDKNGFKCVTVYEKIVISKGEVYVGKGYLTEGLYNMKTCIARSTMKSEFIALDKADEEPEWLQNFLEDIPYCPKPVVPLKYNVSDPLTKGLSREGVERISKGMSLRPRTSQHGGNST